MPDDRLGIRRPLPSEYPDMAEFHAAHQAEGHPLDGRCRVCFPAPESKEKA